MPTGTSPSAGSTYSPRSSGSEVGARPLDVAADLRLPPSSLSRRLDRLQEEGWIARHREMPGADLRAVEVELTRTGRRLWREMNVSYRRALQAQFAIHLDDADIADIARVLDTLFGIDEPDEEITPEFGSV